MLQKLTVYIVLVIIIVTGVFLIFHYNKITSQKLGQFAQLTKEDPLFYDPALDVELLKEALIDMQEIDRQIVAINDLYQAEEQDKSYLDGWTLWPETFLGKFPEVHKLTTTFLDSPTAKKGTTTYQE
jgi:hypothetical protein